MSTPLETELIGLMAQMRKDQLALDAAELAVRKSLEEVINALLPVGTKFNRRDRNRPPYLFHVKTMRGRDHNTNIFVIASPIIVKVNIPHPSLSTWSCEATPISEKTGKPLNGASHGADGSGQTTVRIKGEFDPSWDGDTFENERLLKVVALASNLLASRTPSTALPVPGDAAAEAAKTLTVTQLELHIRGAADAKRWDSVLVYAAELQRRAAP